MQKSQEEEIIKLDEKLVSSESEDYGKDNLNEATM